MLQKRALRSAVRLNFRNNYSNPLFNSKEVTSPLLAPVKPTFNEVEKSSR